MICFILFFISVLSTQSLAVKVNMQGSLSLGKEVIDTISFYARKNNLSGRRFYVETDAKNDVISLIVNSAFLCRDLNFCQGELGTLLNEYIITLSKTIEKIFEGLIEDQNTDDPKEVIFEDELKALIEDIKILLKNADDNKNDDANAYPWIDLIKKINANNYDRAIKFASRNLKGLPQDVNEVKKKLTQKLVTALTEVEIEFEHKLCDEHNICTKSYECTKALNTVLEQIEVIPDDRVKEFVRYFYETLPDTYFYYKISDVTANEFQAILNDMAYSENIQTKNVLSIVHKTVENRLNSVKSKGEISSGRDVKLVHAILSDMDHFYSKQEREPFHGFLSEFFDWSQRGGKFRSPLRGVMKEIQNVLTFESDELLEKLSNEVRVFMEITVDPDK